MTVLIVTGSRRGRGAEVAYWLDRFVSRHGMPERLVLGDAQGVDAEARAWAAEHGLPCEVYRAQWHAFGKGAGGMRNQAMVEQAGPGDWCIAFPDEHSVGTYDCIRRARDRGIQVTVIRPYRAHERT